MEKYKFDGKICGNLFKAIDKSTGCVFAVKKIWIDISDDGIDCYTLREVSILRSLRHDNVVKLLDAITNLHRRYLVFEFVSQSLYEYIHLREQAEYLSHDTIRHMSRQLLEGLTYCHSMGVMHRDLRPWNIFVTQEGGLKIAGFGMSRFVTPATHTLSVDVISLYYRPPELLLGWNKYSFAVDVWSAACLIAELCSKQVLFSAIDSRSAIGGLVSVFSILGTPNKQIWPELPNMPYYADWFPVFPSRSLEKIIPNLSPQASDLLEGMLIYDPTKRLSAKDALRHAFFSVAENPNKKRKLHP